MATTAAMRFATAIMYVTPGKERALAPPVWLSCDI
jgi:hypothetical protein